MKQNYCSTAVAAACVRKPTTGKLLRVIMLGFLFFLLFTTRSFGQKVQKGHENKKGQMNFSDVGKYFKEHPQKIKRMKLENEEDEEKRPDPKPVSDPSLIRKRAAQQGRTQQPNSGQGSVIPSGSMPVSNAPTALFESTLDNNSTIPPDTHGAVDSNYCITTINSTVKIQTRAGAPVTSVTLNQFWLPVLPGGGAFDPRAHYDPYTNRWFIISVSGANTTASSVLIAVSKTSNPTGGWWMYRVLADPSAIYWLDFPNVGFNKKWLTVTGNLFGSGYGGAKVYIFDKAGLMSGAGASYTSIIQTSSFTICPAITYDNAQENLFAVESYNGGSGLMRLWKISGPVGSESMTTVAYPANTQRWRGSGGSSSTADFAPQAGISNKLQTNDDRVTQMVFMNNKLWFAHTVFLPYNISAYATRSSVQWWQTDTTGTPLQIGRIDDSVAGNFYAFPSIAVNTSEDAVIGFSLFSSSIYPSAGYTLRMHSDAIDSMRPVQVYKPGLSSYYKTYGGSRNRWGDYSATCLDPINQKDFWTIQEVASATANVWDTWWANIIPDGCSVAAISGVSTVCAGSSTTLADATAGGAWSSSNTAIASVSSSGVVSALSAGTATITYAAAGCSATKTITVNAMPAAIGGVANVCSGSTTTLTNTSTGGTWSSSNTSVASVDATTGVVNGVTAGVATITYSTGAGCAATKPVTVNAAPAAIGGAATVCAGATTTLTNTTSGGAWRSSDTAVATVSSAGVVSAVSPGTTTITYAIGGCYATSNVTVNTAPAAIGGSSTVCAGSATSMTNTITGGTWSSSNASVATVDAVTGMVNGVSAGSVTMTYSTGTGCTATKTITVNTAPSAISGSTTLCPGSTTSLSNATTGGAWSSSNTAVATVSSSGVVSAVSAGTTTITYAVGSCTATTIVTVNAAPGVISGSSTVCTGATTAFTNPSTGGTWSSSNTSVATVESTSGIVSGTGAGVATITYTTGAGCATIKTITVNASPSAIGGSTTVCMGSTTGLSNPTSGGIWSSSNTAVATVGTTGVVTGVSAGTAVVTYTTSGGCYATATVSVNPSPSAGTISGSSGVTTGTTIALSTSVAGGVWASGNPAVATVNSTGVVTGVAVGTANISYSVSNTCGTAHATKTVTVTAPVAANSAPAFTGGASQALSVCQNSAVTPITSLLAITDANSGQTETWSVVSGPSHGTLGGFNTTAVSTGGTVTPSGLTYKPTSGYSGADAFTVKVSDGVASATIVINVTITATPVAGTISGLATITAGIPVTFTSSGTPGGTWSSSSTAVATVGATTGVVTGMAAGNVVISYAMSNSCGLSSTSIKVKVKAATTGNNGNGKGKSVPQVANATLYPNPVRSTFTLVTPDKGVFFLFNSGGNLVTQYTVNEGDNTLTMDSRLQSGIYIGKYVGDHGSSESIQIVYEP